jgi:hypothetical protein
VTDRKHVHVAVLTNFTSMYCNYKETFSIILLTIVDANYNFMSVNIEKEKAFLIAEILKVLRFTES